MNPNNFDLTSAPWLPCRAGPRRVELGLRELLRRAHELDGLVDPSPLVVGALHRLLAVLLHDLLGGPLTTAEQADHWSAGRFDAEAVDAYFAEHRDRFDLFSPDRPFFQDPGFTLKAPDPIARLAAELASGNNVTLFDHSVDGEPEPMPAAVAARWLVAHQTYGLGGGQGPTSEKHGKHPYASHAPAALGANVIPLGRNLFQTLVLNLVPGQRMVGGLRERGKPVWRRDTFPRPAKERAPDGYLDLLTWPNRCCRLVPEELDGETVVRWAYTAQGGALAKEPPFRDPWFAWRSSKDGAPLPLRLSANRSLWRDSTALFSFAEADTFKGLGEHPRPTVLSEVDLLLADLGHPPAEIGCLVVGIEFDQSRIELWRAEELPVPRSLLSDGDVVNSLQSAVSEADELGRTLRKALWVMATRLLEPNGERADTGAATDLVDSWRAMPSYWSELDEPYHQLLRGLADNWEQARLDWRRDALRAADRAFDRACQQVLRDDRGLQALARADHFFRAATRSLRPPREEVTVDES